MRLKYHFSVCPNIRFLMYIHPIGKAIEEKNDVCFLHFTDENQFIVTTLNTQSQDFIQDFLSNIEINHDLSILNLPDPESNSCIDSYSKELSQLLNNEYESTTENITIIMDFVEQYIQKANLLKEATNSMNAIKRDITLLNTSKNPQYDTSFENFWVNEKKSVYTRNIPKPQILETLRPCSPLKLFYDMDYLKEKCDMSCLNKDGTNDIDISNFSVFYQDGISNNVDNTDHNVLSTFSNECEKYTTDNNYEDNSEDIKQFIIFYLNKFNISVILEEDSTLYKKFIPSFFSSETSLFVNKVDTITVHNEYSRNLLLTMFNNIFYENEETLKNRITLFKDDIQNMFNFKKQFNIEDIRQLLDKFYFFTNDKEHRIKSSVLLDFIVKTLSIENKLGIRNRISKELLTIGFKKYRLSDGFYYYGLKHRFFQEKNNEQNIKHDYDCDLQKTVESYSKKRKEEETTYRNLPHRYNSNYTKEDEKEINRLLMSEIKK